MINLKGWCLVALAMFICMSMNARAETETSLEINYANTAPQMLQQIPNQTWAVSTNLTDALDLDDYFIDDEPINYTVSSADSIQIFINETTHLVSFYPLPGFVGNRTVTFYAYDGELTSPSNVVYLSVIQDTTPPLWFNPSTDTNEIRQNSIIGFSTDWQDNSGLSKFILAVDQGGGWINQTPTDFSGKTNTSHYSLQISAPAGSIVRWYMIGFDTSGNMNATSRMNFTVLAPAAPPSADKDNDEDEQADDKSRSFEVDPKNGFKIDMLKGDDKTVSFKVTNTGTIADIFSVEVTDLDKFTYTMNRNNFTLAAGESFVVTITFKSVDGALPDLYYGFIKVKTSYRYERVPIVIQLNALVTKLGINLTLFEDRQYFPLQDIGANVTITNLQDIQPSQIYAYYAIVDFNGNVIDSSSDQLLLQTKFVTLQKTLKLPEELGVGTYIFMARAVTNGSIAIDSRSFEVGEKRTFASFVLSNIWVLVFAGSIFMTIIIGFAEFRSRRRLNLLNMYIMTNELVRLVKENNFIEAQKVYIKIKNYYHETIPEEIFNNKEKLNEQIKSFAQSAEANLYAKQAQAPAATTAPAEKGKADAAAPPAEKAAAEAPKEEKAKTEKKAAKKKVKTKAKKNGKKK